jgi:ribosomal protein S16
MDNIVQDTPNLTPETVPVQKVDTGLEAIAQKMAAMRNQPKATEPVETGETAEAKAETPVAPEGTVIEDSDTNSVEPEVAELEAEYAEGTEEGEAPEVQVSETADSPSDIIDFLEFAEMNPNAKFRFKRNGKEIEVDAKKAASILGQGAAISEEARQLKVDRAEFDEYQSNKRAETEGLYLAMEFTVVPQLRKAYDEIIKTQGYQTTFQQQLANTQDPATRARIQASLEQNEKYIQQQANTINTLKPNVDQFKDMRSQQVREIIDNTRKSFKDKELRNQYVFNEIRDNMSKGWTGAKTQLVPGVDNIDLICADEHILSLVRDGLKYRDRPKAKSAGSSIAALTTRKAGTTINPGRAQDEMSSLREKARGGDTKAADNLLMAQMRALRARR